MKLLSLFVLVTAWGTNGFALPTQSNIQARDFDVLMGAMSDDYDFEGIVKLDNCSGSLVRLENSNESDPAMVMTNGHCVKVGMGGFIKPGEFISNKPTKRSFQFLNKDGTLSRNMVESTQIIYATMTGTDMALYELSMSYGEIQSRFQVRALVLDSKKTTENEPIDILSGYWRKGYSCNLDGFVYKMKEDAYTWIDSLRYQRGACKTIHGTSGSPIISKRSGKVVGINNTGNDEGGRCTMNNPCEVNENGEIYVEQGRSYGQQTYLVYSCLNESRKIDVKTRGCKLFVKAKAHKR